MTDMISSAFPYELKRVSLPDSEMACLDEGESDSTLWRNLTPHVAGLGRCLAPDIPGMDGSGKTPY